MALAKQGVGASGALPLVRLVPSLVEGGMEAAGGEEEEGVGVLVVMEGHDWRCGVFLHVWVD